MATELSPSEQLVVEGFANDAQGAMLSRMIDGLRRGWGIGFRTEYTDTAVVARLFAAEQALQHALINFRLGAVGVDEVRKRAADVANQAFMLADADRLADPGSR
jgi:hypothetical protein